MRRTAQSVEDLWWYEQFRAAFEATGDAIRSETQADEAVKVLAKRGFTSRHIKGGSSTVPHSQPALRT